MDRIVIGQYDKIVIITDLEPDDFVAITILLKSGQIGSRLLCFIISAWRNVEHKARFFRKFLDECFPVCSNIRIYLGEPNDNDYYFPFELTSNEMFPSYQNLDPSNSLIVNLASVKELMFYYKNIPRIYEHCQLVINGSFSIRTVLLGLQITPSLLCRMLYSFSGVLYYENFYAVREKNNVTNPELLNIIKNNYMYLKNIIKWWNQIVSDNCKKICDNRDSSTEEYEYNFKILNAIKDEPYQFTNSDTGLIVILLNPQLQHYARPVSINFAEETFYTQFVKSDNSKIKIIECEDDNLYTKQIDIIKQLLNY